MDKQTVRHFIDTGPVLLLNGTLKRKKEGCVQWVRKLSEQDKVNLRLTLIRCLEIVTGVGQKNAGKRDHLFIGVLHKN